MDREPELLKILKERGPITVRRLKELTGISKRCINGALHGSKKTTKVEQGPRPLWSYSETAVRPVKESRRNVVPKPELKE